MHQVADSNTFRAALRGCIKAFDRADPRTLDGLGLYGLRMCDQRAAELVECLIENFDEAGPETRDLLARCIRSSKGPFCGLGYD